MYIGKAKNFDARIYSHKRCLRKNCHTNFYLQEAYNKLGESNFDFVVIEFSDVSDLDKKEREAIRVFQTTSAEFGYNIKLHKTANNIKINEGSIEGVNKQALCNRNGPISFRLSVENESWLMMLSNESGRKIPDIIHQALIDLMNKWNGEKL
jgi:group I intron endonuclease